MRVWLIGFLLIAVGMIVSATADAAAQITGGDWVLPIATSAANEPFAASDDARWVLGNSSSLLWTHPGAQAVNTSPGIDRAGSPAMSLRGDILVPVGTADRNGTTIRAITSDGSTRYSTLLDGIFVTMAVGNDGATYVLLHKPFQQGSGAVITRLSADGQVEWRREDLPNVGQLSSTVAMLNTTHDGVSLILASDAAPQVATIIRRDGSFTSSASLPSPPGCFLVVHDTTSNQLGDTYVVRRPYQCGNTASYFSISRVTAAGDVAWTVDRPDAGAGQGLMQLSALPDGNVLMTSDRYDQGEVLGRAAGETLAADQWPGDHSFGLTDNSGTLAAVVAGTDTDGSTFFLLEEIYRTCPGAPATHSCNVIELRRRSASGVFDTIAKRVPEEGTFRFGFNAESVQLMPGWVVDHEIEAQTDQSDRLVGFAVPNSRGPYRPYTTCQQRTDCPTDPPPPPAPAPPPPPPLPGRPVVLVPGLAEETGSVGFPATSPTAPRSCSPAKVFKTLCERLQALGHPVYVVPAAKGANGPMLDNGGDLDVNAQRLRDFLASVPGRPIVAGHSMGGLIARIAISRYPGVRNAAALVTIGTPHEGSPLADLLETGRLLPCPAPLCAAIRVAAQAIESYKGEAAIRGLTLVARGTDRLPIPPVPVTVFAGTPIGGWLRVPTYLLPNDGAVGQGSAWGGLSNLGQTTRVKAPLWHLRSLTGIDTHDPDNEFDDPFIVSMIHETAGRLAISPTARAAPQIGTSQRAAIRASAASAPQSTATSRATRVVLTQSRTVSSPTTLPATTENLLSKAAFNVTCDGNSVPALRLGSGLYGLFGSGAALGCRRPRLMPARGRPIALTQATRHVRATLTLNRNQIRIRLKAARRISRAWLGFGRRRISLRIKSGRVDTRLRVTRGHRPDAILATVGGHHYSAPVPRVR